MVKSNKLSIYLVKDEYQDFDDVIKEEYKGTSKEVEGGIFYYDDSDVRMPSWVQNFFGDKLDDIQVLQMASSKGVFFCKVNVKENVERIFILSFGHGRHMFKEDCVENRFGLKTTLNVIDHNTIRQISKKELSSSPKISIEQKTGMGNYKDYNIDFEQEILNGISGLAKDRLNIDFGKIVYGSKYLSISVRRNVDDIFDFLKMCYERYDSDDYRTNFSWIDKIKPIDSSKSKILTDYLIQCINSSDPECFVWMAVPEIITEYSHVQFSYQSRHRYDDINIEDFLIEVGKTHENITIQDLEKEIVMHYNEVESRHFSGFKCLSGEVLHEGNKFILSDGEWYEIEKDFSSELDNFFSQMIEDSTSFDLNLPDCFDETEAEYNARAAREAGYLHMDKKLIEHHQRHSKIEFCDLMSTEKDLIHVKHRGTSSTYSHLFYQGYVSSELIRADSTFLNKVNGKISEIDESFVIDNEFDPSDYRVVYAIITDKDNLNFPLFSKVTLRSAVRSLRLMGYQVFLKRIKKVS